MISVLKGVLPGALVTWLVALFMGSGGSRGGILNIHELAVAGYDFYWSWPLFLGATALFAVIFMMMK